MKQKGINVATVDFENSVTELINTCALPASTIRLVLANVLNEVVRIEKSLVDTEREEFKQNEEGDT